MVVESKIYDTIWFVEVFITVDLTRLSKVALSVQRSCFICQFFDT